MSERPIERTAQLMREHVEDYVQIYFANAKRKTRYWVVGNVSGDPGESMMIHEDGYYRDRATEEHKGDLVDLHYRRAGYNSPLEAAKALVEEFRLDVRFAAQKRERMMTPASVAGQGKRYRPQAIDAPPVSTAEQPDTAWERVRDYWASRGISETTLVNAGVGAAAAVGPLPGWKGDSPWQGPWTLFASPGSGESPDGANWKAIHIERRPDKHGRERKQVIGPNKSQRTAPHLVGWPVADRSPGRYLVLTEGESDWLTWLEAGFLAMSIPDGPGDREWLEQDYDALERFDLIYVAFDPDETGREGVEALWSRFGYSRMREVRMPDDANACLTKHGYGHDEFRRLLEHAVERRPESFATPTEFEDQVCDLFLDLDERDPENRGIVVPYGSKTVEMLPGEYSVLSGHDGMGKTAWLNQLIIDLMWDQGVRPHVISLEWKPAKLLQHMVPVVTGHDQPARPLIRQSIRELEARGLSLLPNTGETIDIDVFEESVTYAHGRWGTSLFILDSIMLTDVDPESTADIERYATRFKRIMTKLNAHLIVVAHPRKGQTGQSGIVQPPTRQDVAGGKSLTNAAANVLFIHRPMLERNEPMPADDPEGRPNSLFIVDKNREAGDQVGTSAMWFNPNTKQFTSRQEERGLARCYIDTDLRYLNETEKQITEKEQDIQRVRAILEESEVNEDALPDVDETIAITEGKALSGGNMPPPVPPV